MFGFLCHGFISKLKKYVNCSPLHHALLHQTFSVILPSSGWHLRQLLVSLYKKHFDLSCDRYIIINTTYTKLYRKIPITKNIEYIITINFNFYLGKKVEYQLFNTSEKNLSNINHLHHFIFMNNHTSIQEWHTANCSQRNPINGEQI